MSKQRSTVHGKKAASAKRTAGAFVSPEKAGQTTQIHTAIRSTVTWEKPMKPMAVEGRRRQASSTTLFPFPVFSYGDNERVSVEVFNQFGERFSYSLPKIPVQQSLPEIPARPASQARAAKSAQRSARAATRDFGDVLELDGDKVISLDADALDGYGERRAAFYIKKFAAG